MKKLHALLVAAIAALSAVPAPSSAQDVVMRRPLTIEVDREARWHAGEFRTFSSSGAEVDPATACGDFTKRRPVDCRKTDTGVVVADGFCRRDERPAATEAVHIEAGCRFAWDVGEWVDPGSTCSAAEDQSRSVVCRRTNDDEIVEDARCGTVKPDLGRTVADYSACTYRWDAGSFVDPGPACTSKETQERPVLCRRTLDDASVPASLCDPATRPASSQEVEDISACSYAWDAGDWVDPGSACTRTETQSRSVVCRSSLDQGVVDDSRCAAGDRPVGSQVVEDFSACTHSWWNGEFADAPGSCTASERRVRPVECRRDLDGQRSDESLCSGQRPADFVDVEDYSACSYSWAHGEYVDPASSCTATETQLRSVWCKRDLDGAVMDDARCDASQRPQASQVVPDYSNCSYEWRSGAPQDVPGACTNSERRPIAVTCHRTLDGVQVGDGMCNPSTRPASFVDVADHAGCSYDWHQSGWIDPGQSCSSAERQTQTVTCRRQQTGETVDASYCPAATRPSEERFVEDFAGCQYAAYNWQEGSWSSSCSSSAQRTRTAQCRRADGAIVADSACTSRGIALSETVTGPNYAGCGYSWREGAWNEGGASCTASEVHTRAVWCQRSDGATVDDSSCGGGRPAATRSVADYSGCTFSPVDRGRSACNGTSYQQYWDCTRSDGTPNFPASNCGKTNPETVGCFTYGWTYGGWNEGGASCTASEYQSRSASCRRSDGAIVADGFCDAGSREATGRNVADYSGCTFTPVDRGRSACNGTSYQQYWDCTRSDGTPNFPASNCGKTNPETVGCFTYSPHSHGQSACSGGQRQLYWDCMRSDGTDGHPASYCGKTNPETVACNDYTYSSSESPEACSNGYQSVSYSCRRSDGANVDPSFCGLPPSSSRPCPSYTWQTGGWSAYGSCSGGMQYRTRAVWCQSKTGESVTTVGDELCGGGRPASTEGQACSIPAPSFGGDIYYAENGRSYSRSFTGSFYEEGDDWLGVGHGNYNYEGFSCGFNLTITYNGQSSGVSADGYMGASGSCSSATSVTVGGRTFYVSVGTTSRGYGTATYRLAIN